MHPGDDPLRDRPAAVHPGDDPLRDRPAAVHPGDDPLSGRRAAVHHFSANVQALVWIVISARPEPPDCTPLRAVW
ncbi:MAG: hypothetical protein C4327_14060 [Meiothermus sp.]